MQLGLKEALGYLGAISALAAFAGVVSLAGYVHPLGLNLLSLAGYNDFISLATQLFLPVALLLALSAGVYGFQQGVKLGSEMNVSLAVEISRLTPISRRESK